MCKYKKNKKKKYICIYKYIFFKMSEQETQQPQPQQNIQQNYISTENELLNILEEMYKYIKSMYGNQIITSNIVIITSQLIQVVEKYKTLTGNQKKMLVISTIKRLVNEKESNNDEKIALLLVIDNTVPHMIDGFVDAINGNIKFDKEKIKSCISNIFFCCK
jgi:hypothetical protein